jgi:hypothetical protein
VLFKKTPKLKHLRPFGCLAFVQKPEAESFEPKLSSGVMVGYDDNEFTYKVYLLVDNKIITSKKVKFVIGQNIQSLPSAAAVCAMAATPQNFKQAKASHESGEWDKAIEQELTAMIDNQVYELVDLPKSRKTVKSRWVFTKKSNGTFKARLVARGFSQMHGVDFTETYAPTAKHDSLRLLLALAAGKKWKISQLDVSTAFLNGELEEEIYLDLPEGFQTNDPKKVWRLKKTLYGLKQSPRIWNQTIAKFFVDLGFYRCIADQSVFILRGEEFVLIILLYVDDMLIFGSDPKEIDWIQQELTNRFKIHEIANGEEFVGYQIIKDETNQTISINQNNFLYKLLNETKFEVCRNANTPFEPKTAVVSSDTPMTAEEREFMSTIPYRSVVGSLNYLACGSRPDIAFATNQLSKVLNNPRPEHWRAVERVLSYLQRVPKYSITYKGISANNEATVQIKAFSDADFGGGDPEDPKSISAYAFILNEGIISWSSKKQETTARSSTESELVAADHCSRHALWSRSILGELGFGELCIPIFSDNKSTIAICEKTETSSRSKHINIQYHAIKESLDRKQLSLTYVETENNLADPMTKALTGPIMLRFIEAWGLQTLRGYVKN